MVRPNFAGRSGSITITASSGLNKDEVAQMVKDAEAHAGEDAKRREAVDAKNRAEALAYETEKFLKDNGEKIPSDKKMKVENAIQALKDALKGGDVDAIKKASEALTADMQAVSADLYAQAKQAPPGAGAPGGGQPPPPPNAGGKADGDVMDADFEMVDDDKKNS